MQLIKIDMIPIISYMVAVVAGAIFLFLVVGGRRPGWNLRSLWLASQETDGTAAASTYMASIIGWISGTPVSHVSPSTSPIPSAPWWVPCQVCSTFANLRCSKCRVPRYCSQKCQITHWKQGHREECHLLAALLTRSCPNQKEICSTSGVQDGHSTVDLMGNGQIPDNPGPSGEAESFEGDDASNSETVKLSDPDVLVCPICFENLSIPVYQCKNGHILCSICSARVKNFCPSCNSQSEHYRCRGIEKILESAKTACPNKKYGCTMIVPWVDRRAHESVCLFPPCCCPITNCGFVGTPSQLSAHVAKEHDKLVIRFSYGYSFRAILSHDVGFRVLLEEKKGTVFVLQNQHREDGNAFSISSIGFDRFFYELTVKYGECTQLINIPTDIVQRFQADHAPTHYLPVPDSYFNSLGEISLKIKIFAQGKRH